jgi:hypothetical protein
MRRVLPFEVDVDRPCTESWASMTGSSRERHCVSCDRQVHDFAAMTPRQIERLVAETGGHLCARITRRQDGSLIMLKPDPGQFGLVALTLSVALGIAPAALAQGVSISSAPSSLLRGTVRDIQGAVIVGSKVTLMRGAVEAFTMKSDETGQFAVSIPSGEYQILVSAPGFSHFSALISTDIDGPAVADVTLKAAPEEVTVQVTSPVPTTDFTTGGEVVMRYGPWYKRLEFHLRHPILYAKHIFHAY